MQQPQNDYIDKVLNSETIVGLLWMNNFSFLGSKLMAGVYVLKGSGSFFNKMQLEIKPSDIYICRYTAENHISWDTFIVLMYSLYALQSVPYKQQQNHCCVISSIIEQSGVSKLQACGRAETRSGVRFLWLKKIKRQTMAYVAVGLLCPRRNSKSLCSANCIFHWD